MSRCEEEFDSWLDKFILRVIDDDEMIDTPN